MKREKEKVNDKKEVKPYKRKKQKNRENTLKGACPITDACGATTRSGSGWLQDKTSEILNAIIIMP